MRLESCCDRRVWRIFQIFRWGEIASIEGELLQPNHYSGFTRIFAQQLKGVKCCSVLWFRFMLLFMSRHSRSSLDRGLPTLRHGLFLCLLRNTGTFRDCNVLYDLSINSLFQALILCLDSLYTFTEVKQKFGGWIFYHSHVLRVKNDNSCLKARHYFQWRHYKQRINRLLRNNIRCSAARRGYRAGLARHLVAGNVHQHESRVLRWRGSTNHVEAHLFH